MIKPKKVTLLTLALGSAVIACALWFVSIPGYRLQLTEDAPLYSRLENVPFEQMQIAAEINGGESVDLLRCIDWKTDIAFEVRTTNGLTGFLYSTAFRANRIPIGNRRMNWSNAFQHPLDSITCLTLIPHFERRE